MGENYGKNEGEVRGKIGREKRKGIEKGIYGRRRGRRAREVRGRVAREGRGEREGREGGERGR